MSKWRWRWRWMNMKMNMQMNMNMKTKMSNEDEDKWRWTQMNEDEWRWKTSSKYDKFAGSRRPVRSRSMYLASVDKGSLGPIFGREPLAMVLSTLWDLSLSAPKFPSIFAFLLFSTHICPGILQACPAPSLILLHTSRSFISIVEVKTCNLSAVKPVRNYSKGPPDSLPHPKS